MALKIHSALMGSPRARARREVGGWRRRGPPRRVRLETCGLAGYYHGPSGLISYVAKQGFPCCALRRRPSTHSWRLPSFHRGSAACAPSRPTRRTSTMRWTRSPLTEQDISDGSSPLRKNPAASTRYHSPLPATRNNRHRPENNPTRSTTHPRRAWIESHR